MRRKLRVVVAALLATLFVLSFAVGCAPTASLSIDPAEVSLTVGAQKSLKVKNGDTTLKNADLTWETGDPTIATVSEKGVVKGVAAGETTVKATASDGSFGEAKVTVTEAPTITVKQGDTVITNSVTVDIDVPVTLTATVSNGASVSWTCTSPDVSIATNGNSVTITGVRETTTPAQLLVNAKDTRGISIDVNVVWANKPQGYYDMIDKNADGDGSIGQNKVPLGKWAFWRDQQTPIAWNGGNVEMQTAEYFESAGSQAGRVHFKMNVLAATSYNTTAENTVQLTFRSPKTANFNGLLDPDKNYVLTAKVTSNFDGIVTINGVEVNLTNGDNSITVPFHHADTGEIRGETDYAIFEYTAFYLQLGSVSAQDCRMGQIELTIDNLQWTEAGASSALNVPSATVSENVVTITDTVNTEGVKGYTIGFFTDSDTPVYTVNGVKGANTIDDSTWANATYTIKVRALAANILFTDSAWSESVGSLTVEHAEYNLPTSEVSEGWYAIFNPATAVTSAKFVNATNTLTLTWTGAGGNWYDPQLFMNSARATSGAKVRFHIQGTGIQVSGTQHTIRVNGVYHDFDGDSFDFDIVADPFEGHAVSIQFGRATDDWGGTASCVTAGTVVITDFEITTGEPAAPGTIGAGEESTGTKGFVYWADKNYNGSTVECSEAKYETNSDGTFTVTAKANCTAGSCNWGFQLFYNNRDDYSIGTEYTLTCTVTSNVDKTITINGQEVALTAGEAKAVTVTFTYNWHNDNVQNYDYGTSLFDMQIPMAANFSIELTIANIKWVPTAG